MCHVAMLRDAQTAGARVTAMIIIQNSHTLVVCFAIQVTSGVSLSSVGSNILHSIILNDH